MASVDGSSGGSGIIVMLFTIIVAVDVPLHSFPVFPFVAAVVVVAAATKRIFVVFLEFHQLPEVELDPFKSFTIEISDEFYKFSPGNDRIFHSFVD